MNVLITGGAGFIGSHTVIRFVKKYPEYKIFNLDALTYAGNLENLREIEKEPNYIFIRGDISDTDFVKQLFTKYKFDAVINLAAESHVDKSIKDPFKFIKSNILGTVNLLDSFKNLWQNNYSNKLFYHISSDEVFGSLNNIDKFNELSPYDPRSPYSASKASSDHFVRAYSKTYNIPFIISNCSNNYGEYQFPEKIIPLFINNIINNKKLPIYGDGNYVRDWLYVKDHVEAIDLIFHNGKNKETYLIGGENEKKNIDLVYELCDLMDIKLKRKLGFSKKLISFTKDRLGHDKRYAIDISKIKSQLSWKPKTPFKVGLNKTIDWYLANKNWVEDSNKKYLT